MIYLNERGELAEGSRTNIFLEKDGQLLTPALSSGLLPGVLRADLLAKGKAQRGRADARRSESADAVFLGNSVRGLVPATRIDGVRLAAASRARGGVLFDDGFVGSDGADLRVGDDGSPEHRGKQESKGRERQHGCDDDLARRAAHAVSV